MSKVTIDESQALPIFEGEIRVDTAGGSITIFMVPAPQSEMNITITKISEDDNIVSLYSEDSLINGSEITVFGLPESAETVEGKTRTVKLQSNCRNWDLIE